MKTRNHTELNISYNEISAAELTNLSVEQAATMAEMFNVLAKRLAETEMLLDSHENNWPIPVIADSYK